MTASLLRTRRFAPLFVTQLLGALNDNLFKSALVVVLTLGVAARDGVAVDALVNLASALLILPFFLFSSVAGQLADALDKARLIRVLKGAEVAVMGLAALGFHLGSLPVLFLALFAMGAQSAFFGPLKYGILPQHLRPKELMAGNGLVETGTFVAILAGTLVGGLVVAVPGWGTALVSGLVVAVALAGWAAARRVPSAPPSAVGLRVDWNPVRGTGRLLGRARRNRPAWKAIVGASWFWFLGALLLAQLPLLATRVLGGDEQTITLLLALFSVGIGAGSLLGERLGGGRIELGVVAPAALGLAGLLGDLAWAASAAPGDGTLPGRVLFDLFALGLLGGVYVVPLYALMQARSEASERSRIVAANNVVNALFMVAAAGFAVGLRAVGLSLFGLWLATAGLALVAAAIAFVLTRDFVLRLLVCAAVRIAYRVRVTGLEHVPDHGAALVVANHVSYADALVLGGLCRRPIRFVVDHRVHDAPVLRWLFPLVRAIPIASRREDPARLERALAEIDRALAEGELVGIFPEGRLTRDGELDAFRPGVERIVAARPVPVVPVALRGLWGSLFSWAGGRPLAKWPRRLFARVHVVAGPAVSPARASAAHLHARVAALRGDAR
ncbi:MAG TPA: MFS transporter [Sandaracinaceae bacterium LLY-WYZ-13_1]|nr:MFS transporter [Sandaracinaceae bacterium LLY-WYZ-13_1]